MLEVISVEVVHHICNNIVDKEKWYECQKLLFPWVISLSSQVVSL